MPKNMIPLEVTLLGHTWAKRMKVRKGKFIATFEVDQDGRLTFFGDPNAKHAKDYHFESSDPKVVKGIADLILTCVKLAATIARDMRTGEKEAILNGPRQ